MVATKLKITRLQEEETTNGFYNHGILERGKKSFDRICKNFQYVFQENLGGALNQVVNV